MKAEQILTKLTIDLTSAPLTEMGTHQLAGGRVEGTVTLGVPLTSVGVPKFFLGGKLWTPSSPMRKQDSRERSPVWIHSDH